MGLRGAKIVNKTFVNKLAFPNYDHTMRAEIIAYMIYSEGPEDFEYVMHFLPKVSRNFILLGTFSPSLCFSANRKLPKVFGAPRIQESVMQNVLHNAFPGILQVTISNGMVLPTRLFAARPFKCKFISELAMVLCPQNP